MGCQKRHEVRQQLKQTLKKVDEGHALTASFSVILSGEERRAIEGSVTAGEKITKLGREETLKSDLTSQITVDMRYGYKGEEKTPITSTIVAFRSEAMKKFVKTSQDLKQCTKDEEELRKLSIACRNTIHKAASLD